MNSSLVNNDGLPSYFANIDIDFFTNFHTPEEKALTGKQFCMWLYFSHLV